MCGEATEKIKIFIKEFFKMGYDLGLVSVTFRDKTPREILNAMKDAGLKVIEWGSDVHCPPESAGEIAKLQREFGVKCCSYGTYFRLGVTPIKELGGYIAAAKTLGTDILRLWCGDKNSEDYSTEEKESLFEQCKAAAKLAEEHKVTLCMECHNYTYTNTVQGAKELIKAVNSENFQMYWQPNQFKSFEENLEYAREVSPYTKHIHVFKWRGQKKLSLYEGIAEWKQFLGCFEGECALLLEFMPDDKLETLKTEAEALREIVK